MPPRRPAWLAISLLYLGLASSLTSFHAFEINFGPKSEKRAERHLQIVNFEDGRAPWAYRVAVPMAVEHPLSDAFEGVGMKPDHAREYGYLTVRVLSTWFTLLLTHLLIAHFASTPLAFAGALLVGALHGPSTEHYWFQPASGPDHVLWLTAALLTIHKRDGWLYPLVFLGTWNRETAAFAIPIYLALRWGTEPLRRTLERAAILGLLWLTPFLMLRGYIELGPHPPTPPAVHMQRNLASTEWQFYALFFAGSWFAIPIAGWKHLCPRLRRLLLVMIPYLGLVLCFGRIREVRLLLPTTVAFVPAAMVALGVWLRPPESSNLAEASHD